MLQREDYIPAPFWFLNHKLEEDELRRQVRLMYQQGIRAFFMHPRAGLKTPYGSNEWFRMIAAAVNEAETLGMKAWLYDEDPFPSGPAGGRLFLDHPEFAARGLRFHELTPDSQWHISADLGEGTLLEALAVRTDEAGNVWEQYSVFDDVGMIRSDFFQTLWPSPYYTHLMGKRKYYHYRAETFYPHLQLELDVKPQWKVYAITAEIREGTKYRYIPDNLNPECVKYFIEQTHEKYKKHLGEKFGTVIPGIFTDETAAGDLYPWTVRFAHEFAGRRGFRIDGFWHRIFKGDTEECRHVRESYWRTVQELFIESFFIPVNDWCKEHNLLLCGHGIGEEEPLATGNGMNIFALQKYVGIPGFDHITPNIPDGKNFTSLNLGGKLVSSAAEQNGEHRVMSECYGCNPYNFGFDGLKKNLHWLAALGVNWLVPHGFHYSYDGFRKDDAGKSFFFQSPDYHEFHTFAAYASRLGFKLGESRSITDLCVLFPESLFRRLHPAETDKAIAFREKLYLCNQTLINRHIQFEFADEKTLEQAVLENGRFQCGKRVYQTLLLPFEYDCEAVKRLKAEGIKVLLPEDMDKLAASKEFGLLRTGRDSQAKPSNLMLQYRETAEGKLIYIFSNQEHYGIFRLQSPLPGSWYFYNVADDTLQKMQDNTFAIEPYGAAVLEWRTDNIQCPDYHIPERESRDFTYMTSPQWDYIPELPGMVKAIGQWSVNFNGRELGEHRYSLIREIMGSDGLHMKRLRVKPIFDQALGAPSVYPAKMEWSATFELGDESCIILAESESFAGKVKVLLNGEEVPPFTRKPVYDPWNIVSDVSKLCRTGQNELKLQWEKAEEFDGLTSMIYIAKELKN